MRAGVTKVKCRNGIEASGVIQKTSYQLNYRKDLLKDPCVYCYGPAQSMEHILPKSEGGADGWTNMAPACFECNGRRGSTPLLMFLLSLGEKK